MCIVMVCNDHIKPLPLFGTKNAGIARTNLCIDRVQVWANKSC